MQVFAASIAITAFRAINELNNSAAADLCAKGLEQIQHLTYDDFLLHTVPAPFAFTDELSVSNDLVRTTHSINLWMRIALLLASS